MYLRSVFIGVSIIIGNICYAFNVNSMNNALKTMLNVFEATEDNKGLITGIITSSIQVGCLLGCIVTSFQKVQNVRQFIMIGDILLVIGSLLQTQNIIILFVLGRVIAGFGGGVVSAYSSIYLKQQIPSEYYHQLGSIYPIIFSLAIILTQLAGFIFIDHSEYWYLYFSIPGSFSLFRLILFITCVKDAKKTSVGEISPKINETFRELSVVEDNYEEKQELGKPHNLVVGYYLQFLFQFCGMNAIMQYSTTIFGDNLDVEQALLLTLIISVIKFVCYTTSPIIASKLGKLIILKIGNIGMLVTILVLIIIFVIDSSKTQLELIFLISFIISNFMSIGPLLPIYLPEILDQQNVAKSWILHWFCAILIVMGFPLIRQYLSLTYFLGINLVSITIGQFILQLETGRQISNPPLK
ncbi:hypothetical protein pb186bvf_006995 [Paramecium bursaria]